MALRRQSSSGTALLALLLGLAALVACAQPAVCESEAVVRVVVKEAPPFAWRDHNGEWAGLAVDLWRRVTEKARLPSSNYEERELESLLDAVSAGDADVGLGAISVTAERETRLDFSHPFFSSGLGVAVSSEADRGGFGTMTAALWSRGLGWMIGGLLVGLVVVGLLITWAERRHNPAFRDAERGEALGRGFWWAYTVSLGHKGVEPRSVLGRVLAASMMAMSILLLSVFVGAIASILTISHFEDRVRGIHDLRRYQVAAVVGTTSERFLVRERVVHRLFPTVDEALDSLLDGTVDCVVYDRPLLLHLAKERSQGGIRVLAVLFDSQDYAFALAPNHEHREAINRALLEIRGTRWWQQQRFHYLGR